MAEYQYPQAYRKAPEGSSLRKVVDALMAHPDVEYPGSGKDWTCPAHADGSPSLGVEWSDEKPGKTVINCSAGCSIKEILRELKLKVSDLAPPTKRKVTGRKTFRYVGADGKPVYDVVRIEYDDGKKDFRQFKPGERRGGIAGIERVLWRLPEVVEIASAGGIVYLVEGEKCAEFLNNGILAGDEKRIATTASGGAKADWLPSMTASLVGARMVNVVADNDPVGILRAFLVAGHLEAEKIPCRVLRSATVGSHDDVVEHIEAGHTLRELVVVSEAEHEAAKAAKPDPGEDANDGSDDWSNNIWPGANTPFTCAQKYVSDFHLHEGIKTLAYWREDFLEWQAANNRYNYIEDMALRKRLYEVFDKAKVQAESEIQPWTPTKDKLNRVIDALQAEAHVSGDFDARTFLDSGRPCGDIISFRNGNYNLLTKELSEPTPNLFTNISLPFDYEPNAPTPRRWLKFLDELWGKDEDSKKALQDWFGYVLSGRVNLHKAFMIIGPPRSGKSTIAHVLQQLVGEANSVAPTLTSMTGDFGLSGWLGKSLAIVGDARFTPKQTAEVTEYLLRISAGDPVEVQRKFKTSLSVVLPTRIMIVSNEFPNIVESSGALVSRFVFLETKRGFTNMEDTELGQKLEDELPGIMAWSLQGLERVTERGHFTTVRSMSRSLEEMEELSSPVKAFMRARCRKAMGSLVSKQEMFDAYREWCSSEGRNWTETQAVFGRNLKAAYPNLASVQRKGKWHYSGVELRDTRIRIKSRVEES
jgi:putative DNA primase/helicase